jgi:hypothetical protein
MIDGTHYGLIMESIAGMVMEIAEKLLAPPIGCLVR